MSFRVWKYDRHGLARLEATIEDPMEAEDLCIDLSSNEGYARVVQLSLEAPRFYFNALAGEGIEEDLKDSIFRLTK